MGELDGSNVALAEGEVGFEGARLRERLRREVPFCCGYFSIANEKNNDTKHTSESERLPASLFRLCGAVGLFGQLLGAFPPPNGRRRLVSNTELVGVTGPRDGGRLPAL